MRPTLLILIVVILQGAFIPLLGLNSAAPDLFLLLALLLALRLPPLYGLLLAYGIGLGQDILGHGFLGLHAAGLGAAALLFYGWRQLLGGNNLWQVGLQTVASIVGQWLAFAIITYWLRNDLVTIDTLRTVFPLQLFATLLLYPVMHVATTWAFGPVRNNETLP